MTLFRRTPGNPSEGNSAEFYILGEIRELRKSMEGRQEELRSEISAVRDAVGVLSEGVALAQSAQAQDRKQQESLSSDVKKMRIDLDQIMADRVKDAASWNGPKKFLAAFGAIAAFITAVVLVYKAIIFFSPLWVPLFVLSPT